MGTGSDSEDLEGFSQPVRNRNRRKLAGWIALILPAILAGVFSLIPNLFERLTAPESSLSYSLISSPSIRTTTGYSRIFSSTIENSGTTRITGVEANLSLAGGVIERMSIGDSSGDRPSIGTAEDGGRMTVRSMFPRERIAVTALATSGNPATKPAISVRSDQTLGAMSAARDEDQASKTARWAAILAALGALTATAAGFFVFRSQKENLSAIDFYSMSARSAIADRELVVDREEVLMFISDLIGHPPLTERLTALEYDCKFVQFADMLAEIADTSRGEQRRRMIAGLRSILLVPYLHDMTRKVIEDYLFKLGAKQISSSFSAEDVKDRLVFRDYARRCFVAEGVKVALTGDRHVGRIKQFFGYLAK